MTRVRVVAAVIEREGRFLLGRRPDEKRHGGLWEFPGGKLDPGENPAGAAGRELDEELAITVREVGERLLAIDDGASPFVIEFFPVAAEGEPEALEHSAVGWFLLEELKGMPLAPADARFVAWYAAQPTRRSPDPGSDGSRPRGPSGSRS